MVTCTTPPFRAAVRLNSGVSPMRKFLGILLASLSFSATAENMTSVPESQSYCFNRTTYCYEWQLASDPGIRVVAWGDEDGIDYSFFRRSVTGKYERLFRVLPVLQDSSRSGGLFWAYPWDMTDIAVEKKGTLQATFDHDLVDDSDVDSPSDQTRLPAVLFIGRTTQPDVKVKHPRFQPHTLKALLHSAKG